MEEVSADSQLPLSIPSALTGGVINPFYTSRWSTGGRMSANRTGKNGRTGSTVWIISRLPAYWDCQWKFKSRKAAEKFIELMKGMENGKD